MLTYRNCSFVLRDRIIRGRQCAEERELVRESGIHEQSVGQCSTDARALYRGACLFDCCGPLFCLFFVGRPLQLRRGDLPAHVNLFHAAGARAVQRDPRR